MSEEMYDEMMELLNSGEIDSDFDNAQEMKNTWNYSRVVKSLKKKIFRCKFHFFGSRMMGVGSEESDIDIFIELGEIYE